MKESVEATIEVTNRFGIHVRPAAAVTKTVIQFRSKVMIICGEKSANARDAVALAALGAGQGALLKVRANGPDAAAALRALQKLFSENFGED